jgi:probable addiction module antidote protein
MKPTKSYQENLIQSLKAPEEAAEYINAALEEEDLDVFLLALRNVAEAHGMTSVSRRAKLNRVSLYRMLSKRGNPEFQSVLQLLSSWGLKLEVQPQG